MFVTVPVAPQNRCSGGITLGGFYTPEQHQDIHESLSQALSMWPAIDPKPFLSNLKTLRPITTSALRGLGRLAMETTFSCGLNSSTYFRAQNDRYLQQCRIAEAFADLRSQKVSTPDILGDTYQLVSFLSHDDQTSAMEFVSRYLAKLLLASNWDLIKLKAHARTLLAVITSHDILNGTPWAVATSRELRHMVRLEHANSTEETCHEVADWVHQHFNRSSRILPDGRSLGDRVLDWMQTHYQEPATLTVAAKAIGISVSTLVHRLPAETGKTFKQLLLEIRTSEAKKLLATSSLEISAVAGHCGFFDQSHFTREFKRSINLTPGQFRKLLAVPENALRSPNKRSLDDPETTKPSCPG
jgi:AraC-like DNA-binding protein